MTEELGGNDVKSDVKAIRRKRGLSLKLGCESQTTKLRLSNDDAF